MIVLFLLVAAVVVSCCLPVAGTLILPPFSLPLNLLLIVWPLSAILVALAVKSSTSPILLLLIIVLMMIPFTFYNLALPNISSFLVSIALIASMLLSAWGNIVWLGYVLYITSFSYKER